MPVYECPKCHKRHTQTIEVPDQFLPCPDCRPDRLGEPASSLEPAPALSPWIVGNDIGMGVAIVVDDGKGSGLIGLSCYGRAETPEERLANAYLMAAAPRLLNACEFALAMPDGVPVAEWNEARDKLRAAIARARPQ